MEIMGEIRNCIEILVNDIKIYTIDINICSEPWKMSAPHIILDCLPSLCQKLSDLVEDWMFDVVVTKIILLVFLRHGV